MLETTSKNDRKRRRTMADSTQTPDFRAGFELGKVYAEVQSYLNYSGESEDGPLARTLLAALDAIGSIPDPGTATQEVIDAWNRDT